MGALIGLAVLVLDVIAIVNVVQSAVDNGKKILWVVLIVLLPVIGMVLYFLIGKKSA